MLNMLIQSSISVSQLQQFQEHNWKVTRSRKERGLAAGGEDFPKEQG
jgi:hypothetical protein